MSPFQLKLQKEQIRDRYQVRLLEDEVDTTVLLQAYKKEMFEWALSATASPSDEMFTLPPINLKYIQQL